MTEKKETFEEALKKLENASEKLKSEDISLEDAIRSYEEGINTINDAARYWKKPVRK